MLQDRTSRWRDDVTQFHLHYHDDALDVDEDIEFEADSAAGALAQLMAEPPGKWFELWRGDHLLCHLSRDRDNLWEIHG